MCKKLLNYHNFEIYQISQTINGNIVGTCSGDNYIKLYDPINFTSIRQILSKSNDQIFTTLAFAPYNEYLITGTNDKVVQVWNY